MRQRWWILAGASTLALGLGTLAAGLEAAASARVVGTVALLDGEAQRSAGKTWRALKQGDKLSEGDHFKTLSDSRMEAKLHDGSLLRLGSNSEMRLQEVKLGKKQQRKKVKARLVIGRVWAKVSKFLGGESDFEVETANAVAGVRGTSFSASTNEAGDTTVKVYSGKVLVSNQPVYAVKGHTKGKRLQVAGPQEISKQQWEELIAGAMQYIQVAASGEISKPAAFELAAADDDGWESWNTERDKLAEKAK